MKKTKAFLLILLGAILGAGGCIVIYWLVRGDVDWMTYLQSDIIPAATLAVSTGAAIWLLAAPTVKKIVAAAKSFDMATKGVTDTADAGKESIVRLAEYTKILEETKASIERMNAAVKDVEKICRIGFTNSDELVRKGYASEIAKVGDSHEAQ